MPSLKEKLYPELVTDLIVTVILVASVYAGTYYYQRVGQLEQRADQVNARIKRVEREAVRVDNKRSGIDTHESSREIDKLEDQITELNALLREE